MQSLAVVMLFHAFLEASTIGSPLLALEEPEAHLHPNAVRALWHVIAALPGQKILTTHSGDLLSEIPMTDLRRLSRPSGAVRGHRFDPTQLTAKQRRQLEYHVRQSRGELLFARCWILVEGETEVTILPAAARKLGTQLERYGVRCVPYRHADIGLYLNVAEQLGITWCSVFEGDDQGQTDRAKAKAALNGRADADAIVELPLGSTTEAYLAASGFEDVYEALVPAQNRALITAPPGTPTYTAEVVAQVPSHKKTEAATEIALKIEAGTAIPMAIRQIVELAVRLGAAG
jgi:putative ATP-dependent endonuclease of OLD family